MAALLFKRLNVKNPVELAQKAHQHLVKLPYESSQDRIVEDLARVLVTIKVGTSFGVVAACILAKYSSFILLPYFPS